MRAGSMRSPKLRFLASAARFVAPTFSAFLFLGPLAAGALVLGVSGALVSCTTVQPQAPKACDVQIVTLNIYAADNINPNERGNPRPVWVRLYQLKSDVRMENATYDEILQRDKEVLGEDFAKSDDIEIFPNDLVQIRFERMKEAAFLAGVAMFHGPKGNSWKTFYTFPPTPAEGQSCGSLAKGVDAGAPQVDPKTAFFIESTKIDNGSQFDESMFPSSNPIRKIDLPKRSAGGGEASAAAGK